MAEKPGFFTTFAPAANGSQGTRVDLKPGLFYRVSLGDAGGACVLNYWLRNQSSIQSDGSPIASGSKTILTPLGHGDEVYLSGDEVAWVAASNFFFDHTVPTGAVSSWVQASAGVGLRIETTPALRPNHIQMRSWGVVIKYDPGVLTAAVGQSDKWTVPAGVRWRLKGVVVSCTTNATVATRSVAVYTIPQNSAHLGVLTLATTGDVLASSSVTEASREGFLNGNGSGRILGASGFLLNAGDLLQVTVSGCVTGDTPIVYIELEVEPDA